MNTNRENKMLVFLMEVRAKIEDLAYTTIKKQYDVADMVADLESFINKAINDIFSDRKGEI